jgi:hypothetical protein
VYMRRLASCGMMSHHQMLLVVVEAMTTATVMCARHKNDGYLEFDFETFLSREAVQGKEAFQ